MIDYGKGIVIAGGFDVSSQRPIDYRTRVQNWNDSTLKNIPVHRLYEGLIVYIVSEKKLKYLVTIPTGATSAFDCEWNEVGANCKEVVWSGIK
jgi:hypothetical protein